MVKILSGLFILVLCMGCSKRAYNSSNWQTSKVTIDGDISDWTSPLRFYDQKSGINYTISNDRYNLYLCFGIPDEYLQTKILRSGLEFGIDTLGKKSFPVKIKFPFGNNQVIQPNFNSKPQNNEGSNVRPDRSSFKLKLLAQAREMQLVGFKQPLSNLITLSNANKTGISAAINFDNRGIMCYEAVIPFSTFYKNELTPSDSNKIFNYQIKINPASKSENGGNRGGGMQGGGMRGGGMGGGMRGGMGGGMRGGMGGGMRGGGMRGNGGGGYGDQRNATMSETTKTTVKLKLAYKQ
jgi:hypothetical protein